jgi:iron complex outermembrane receptor protein
MKRTAFSVAGTVSLFMLTQPAAAQGPSPEETVRYVLEEIVVTARKREESLQSAPLAISAFSADMLEKQQFTRIDDLSKTVPSLHDVLIATDITAGLGFATKGFGPGRELGVSLTGKF